jgi:hypothetical protein
MVTADAIFSGISHECLEDGPKRLEAVNYRCWKLFSEGDCAVSDVCAYIKNENFVVASTTVLPE